MTEAFVPSAGLHLAPESDAEIDRELLTETLFRCIAQCDNDDDIASLRAQVVSINIRVADSLARRYFGHGENNDDLRQVAYLGLTKAVRGFDARSGHNFLSYAVPTITGELKKHFRDHCWTVRPPRRIQDLQRDITSARQLLGQEFRREPTVDELAEELGVSADQVIEALAAKGCFSPGSLDVRLKADSTTTLAELIPGDNREFEQTEVHLLLAPLINGMPEADREILALRFFEEWTQEQIAQHLGTSQMQISRRLSRLMGELRSKLEPSSHCA